MVDIDTRLRLAAAKSVIVPDTVVIDHGKVFLSEVFLRAADTWASTGFGTATWRGASDDAPRSMEILEIDPLTSRPLRLNVKILRIS